MTSFLLTNQKSLLSRVCTGETPFFNCWSSTPLGWPNLRGYKINSNCCARSRKNLGYSKNRSHIFFLAININSLQNICPFDFLISAKVEDGF
jgi:hypothetical protein